jgi:N-acetylmuramoyl-L-alanine amidase
LSGFSQKSRNFAVDSVNMSRKFIAFLMLCCIAVTSFAAKQSYILVIDAGHGGKDAGALGKYSKEKTINLNVAVAFGRYVEQNCPDVKVI